MIQPASAFGFAQKKFQSEGLLNMGALGLDQLHGTVIAMGDSNADQL